MAPGEMAPEKKVPQIWRMAYAVNSPLISEVKPGRFGVIAGWVDHLGIAPGCFSSLDWN